MISRDTWIRVLRESIENLPTQLVRRTKSLRFPETRTALALVGVRRSGKTYMLFQTIVDLIRDGVAPEKIAYVNLEDPRLINVGIDDLLSMREAAYENAGGRDVTFFIDEVQVVRGWEKFVNLLVEQGHRVAIAGSSSKLLVKEVATVMRGRGLPVMVWPFSFAEFLRARGVEARPFRSSSEEATLRRHFKDYLFWGGFPQVVLEPEIGKKQDALTVLMDQVVLKDVVERWKVENIHVLRILLKMIAHSPYLSLSATYRNLKGMGLHIGKETIGNYLEYLNDAFIFFPLPPYGSYKQAQFKSYMVDNGFLMRLGMLDEPRLLENAVFVELLRRGFVPGESLFYVLGDYGEVDFLAIRREETPLLIQVCFQVGQENFGREVRPLLSYSREMSAIPILLVKEETDLPELPTPIKAYEIHKWLIQNQNEI